MGKRLQVGSLHITDFSGDTLDVQPTLDDTLWFMSTLTVSQSADEDEDEDFAGILLERTDVVALRDYLNKWLEETKS